MWWFCRIKWSDVTGLPSLQRGWIYPVCWRKNKTEFWLSEEDWLSLYKLFYLLLGHRARPHFPPFLLVWCHCVAELQAKECKIYMPLPDPFHDSMQKNLEKEKKSWKPFIEISNATKWKKPLFWMSSWKRTISWYELLYSTEKCVFNL